MKILSIEQIQELPYSQCLQARAAISRNYDLDRPILEYQSEIWPVLDELTTMICSLEDRIRDFEDTRIASMEPDIAVQVRADETPPRTGPRRRRYRIDDEIYASIQAASIATGMAINTLRTYVARRPERYNYVDHEE